MVNGSSARLGSGRRSDAEAAYLVISRRQARTISRLCDDNCYPNQQFHGSLRCYELLLRPTRVWFHGRDLPSWVLPLGNGNGFLFLQRKIGTGEYGRGAERPRPTTPESIERGNHQKREDR